MTTSRWLARVEGQKLGFYWAIAAIVGAASISASAAEKPQRLLLPILIMIAYAWAGYRNARFSASHPALHSARVAQLADSVYFLGFLWTLWALIDSFVLKSMSGAQGVFRVFGYALVTTATGMFLRLLLLQFRYTAQDQAAEVEFRVEEQLEKFSAQLTRTARSLEEWSEAFARLTAALNSNVQRIGEQTADLEQQLKEVHRQSLEELYRNISAGIQNFGELLRPRVDELSSASAEIEQALSAGAQGIERGMKDAGERLRASEIPAQIDAAMRRLAVKVEEIETALAALAAGIRAGGQVTEAVGQLPESLRTGAARIGEELEQLAVRIREIRVPDDVEDKSRVFKERVAEVEEGLRAVAAAFRNGSQTVTSTVTVEVQSGAETIRREIDGFAKRIGEFGAPLQTANRDAALERSIQDLESAISLLADRLPPQARVRAEGRAKRGLRAGIGWLTWPFRRRSG
ncbi:MAG TPA: hypothetical protein VFQ79_14660 [Bryobacteraceae bacterium]|nr:hypothetical protein [Bryobacteraceae bacterium]